MREYGLSGLLVDALLLRLLWSFLAVFGLFVTSFLLSSNASLFALVLALVLSLGSRALCLCFPGLRSCLFFLLF